MAKKGVKLSFSLAKDVREVVGRVLGDNGQATTGGSASTQPRKPRFYQAPAGGIATPLSSTQPSSAVCTLMKFNAAGTTLESTNTTETVFSFTSFSAGEIFEGKAGRRKDIREFCETKSGRNASRFGRSGFRRHDGNGRRFDYFFEGCRGRSW